MNMILDDGTVLDVSTDANLNNPRLRSNNPIGITIPSYEKNRIIENAGILPLSNSMLSYSQSFFQFPASTKGKMDNIRHNYYSNDYKCVTDMSHFNLGNTQSPLLIKPRKFSYRKNTEIMNSIKQSFSMYNSVKCQHRKSFPNEIANKPIVGPPFSFNKFNQHNAYLNENTEILSINIKLSDNKTQMFKLRRFDDIHTTILSFCEDNHLL
jgi:hypothetical protein